MQSDFGFNFDNSYARLPGILFSFQEPASIPAPQAVVINDVLAEFLGLSPQALRSEAGTAVLAGNENPPGGLPLAQAYAGHQFGHFTMLGDGRAILIGEQITPSGQRYDLQLKGSGRTPYSRGGDGKAALGPMLREYIISEAMHSLKIPTTRSLAVVTTGEQVQRERLLPGAVLTRVAASHLRVGTFQYASGLRDEKVLKQLADYAIKRHYPDISLEANKYLALFRAAVRAQASLVAGWMLVGFVHGVMNTDNMTISGETIDYGPCAF
ncbi:MAG: protein adenylyltransferase SelO family protein, partial [Syntrophomonadaceae bacterium]